MTLCSLAARLCLGCLLAAIATAQAAPTPGPVEVRIVRNGQHFTLQRAGKPYRIRGAGISGGDLREFARQGGNSIRTWNTHTPTQTGQQILDEAHALGLTVALCIHLERERDEFDYDDEAAVARQFQRARREVLAYKDHPALLAWIIGNEMNFDYTNPRVFDAVNDISRMIHTIDGKHPTTTTLAGYPAPLARVLEEQAPDLDFLSLQLYANLADLPQMLRMGSPHRPYMITEWGAVGFWETVKTPWGAPIEADSSEKAAYFRRGWETLIKPSTGKLIGDYVFLWGQKQERTPTWFGMFLETGERSETVEVMHGIWAGKTPSNRVPRVQGMRLHGRTRAENITLVAGELYEADFLVADPDGDDLRYRWELKPESDALQVGGDHEEPIPNIPGAIPDPGKPRISLRTPERTGAYRLYAYAYDDRGSAAYANIPFLVVR